MVWFLFSGLILLMTSFLSPEVGLLISLLMYASVIVIFVGAKLGSWYSAMIYLMYLGAVLILFFYVFLIVPNPFYSGVKSYLTMLPLAMFLSQMVVHFGLKKTMSYKVSDSLLKKTITKSFFLMVCLLLCILWLMTKLGPLQSASLRPWY